LNTLGELLEVAAGKWPMLRAVSLHDDEPWAWSYAELLDASRRVARYLRDQGVGKGDRVVFWGPNRPEWVAAFFGAQMLGTVAVPLDVRSLEDLLDAIDEQTEPRYMFIGREQAKGLERSHSPHTVLEDLRTQIAGVEPLAEASPVEPEDIAELVFTSGTTGHPKGVILTHRNITTNVRMLYALVTPTPQNRVLSLLPLSHMFEQTTGLFTPLSGGSSITYVSSLRPDVIFEAMAQNRVTNMSCVPQVLELFRAGVDREVRHQGKEKQFRMLMSTAGMLPIPARRMLLRQLHSKFGGALTFMVVGGAAADPELCRWWERAGIKVIAGYGMTEASPVVAAHSLRRRTFDSVGPPLSGIDVRIADDGEILIRGDNVTSGYWRNDDATHDAFAEGWYRTGDIGSLDERGDLRLRGRKKSMIVLANGMKVHPEDVEAALALDSRVKNSVVIGLEHGKEVEVHAVLLTDHPEEAADMVRAANQHLAPHQHIRHYTIWPDNSFPLTPTLKARRPVIIERVTQMHKESAAHV
jgi:long-chain acyl-CoA synthetase